MAIKFRVQEVKSRPMDPATGKVQAGAAEIVIGTVDVIDMETPPTLQELLDEGVTEEELVKNYVRQDTQDRANKLRGDYHDGFKKQKRKEQVDALLARVAAGDVGAMEELKKLL